MQAADAPRIFIIQYSSNRDGSAFSGLLLADGLCEAGWETHVAFGFDGPIIEQYAAAGHATHIVPHKNWLRRGRSHQFIKDVWLEWQRAKYFETLIDEVAPDAVYVNTAVSLAGAVAARRRNIPSVWHLREMFDDIGGEMRAPRWARPLVPRLLRRCSHQLVANSQATTANLMGDNWDAVPIVPNAVRAAFFENTISKEDARKQFQFPQKVKVIGLPGTLRPMKGHPFFFRSVASLLREHSNVLVAVTGDGAAPYVKRIRGQVQELGIHGQIRFLGWIDDMPEFYRACDMCCIPSRAEPFGRTVIEAFATQTPVVATAVGGMQDTIADGETGMLVPYGDEVSLRNALKGMLDSQEVRQKMSHRARIVAEKEYHERVYKHRSVEIVEKVMRDGHHL